MLNCQILVARPVLWMFQVYNSKVRHSSWQDKKILPDNLIGSFCSNSQHQNSISRYKRLDHLAGSTAGRKLWQIAPLMPSGYLLPRSVGQLVGESGLLFLHCFLNYYCQRNLKRRKFHARTWGFLWDRFPTRSPYFVKHFSLSEVLLQ